MIRNARMRHRLEVPEPHDFLREKKNALELKLANTNAADSDEIIRLKNLIGETEARIKNQKGIS